MAKEAGPYYE
jgi:hypothetical protein